jgi:hypothetical protein
MRVEPKIFLHRLRVSAVLLNISHSIIAGDIFIFVKRCLFCLYCLLTQTQRHSKFSNLRINACKSISRQLQHETVIIRPEDYGNLRNVHALLNSADK